MRIKQSKKGGDKNDNVDEELWEDWLDFYLIVDVG